MKHKTKYKNKYIKKYKALTLMVSVIVLTIVLVLTVNTIKNTQNNTRISTNFQSNSQAQMAAQAAVLEGQQYITDQKPLADLFSSSCLNGLCTYQKINQIWSYSPAWQNAKTLSSNLTTKSKVTGTPVYIIEYMGDKYYQDSLSIGSDYGNNQDVSKKPIYRITGKSKGQRGQKESIIQSTVY